MTTFDGWETQLYGDVIALPGQLSDDELMHFRTKGSKNGVRRYQTESGEWTPLGLKERKAREGWGQKRAERKSAKAERRAAKVQRKIEKRDERKARVAAAKEAFAQRRAKNSLKNLSDEELQKRINRVKKEIEYKELTKNPVVKLGENLIKSYFENKDRALEREMKRADLIVRQQEARQKLLASKAALTQARGSVIDNLTGGAKRKQAKAQLINAKADKTVRGAIRGAVSNVIKKEGERIVGEMGDKSAVMKAGRAVKNAVNKNRENVVETLKRAYAQDHDAIVRKKKKKESQVMSNLKG